MIMEINTCQLFFRFFLIKILEKCGAHVKGWETCAAVFFLFFLVAQHALQQTVISYVYLFRRTALKMSVNSPY